MNKGKNKGKIQKSRQNAEGREAGSFLGKAFDSYHKFLSNKVINFVINMILAIGTVLPFMMKMHKKYLKVIVTVCMMTSLQKLSRKFIIIRRHKSLSYH